MKDPTKVAHTQHTQSKKALHTSGHQGTGSNNNLLVDGQVQTPGHNGIDSPAVEFTEAMHNNTSGQNRDKEGEDATATIQGSLQGPTLTFNNSFTLLDEDLDISAGETGLVDKENSQIITVRSSDPEHLTFSTHVLELVHGRQSFPITSPSISSTPLPTVSEAFAAIDASVKATLDNTTSSSMSQPVTTRYDSLTSDMLPSNQNPVLASKPSLHSAAALKSVQILSKLWGDEVEEEDNDEATPSIFEQNYPSLSESTKAERKQKKQVNKVKPTSFNSAGMRSRAQKGTSKADLAYNE
jgi:hypothetical protein